MQGRNVCGELGERPKRKACGTLNDERVENVCGMVNEQKKGEKFIVPSGAFGDGEYAEELFLPCFFASRCLCRRLAHLVGMNGGEEVLFSERTRK